MFGFLLVFTFIYLITKDKVYCSCAMQMDNTKLKNLISLSKERSIEHFVNNKLSDDELSLVLSSLSATDLETLTDYIYQNDYNPTYDDNKEGFSSKLKAEDFVERNRIKRENYNREQSIYEKLVSRNVFKINKNFFFKKPANDEYFKLLENSFPNYDESFGNDNKKHVRVKRKHD